MSEANLMSFCVFGTQRRLPFFSAQHSAFYNTFSSFRFLFFLGLTSISCRLPPALPSKPPTIRAAAAHATLTNHRGASCCCISRYARHHRHYPLARSLYHQSSHLAEMVDQQTGFRAHTRPLLSTPLHIMLPPVGWSAYHLHMPRYAGWSSPSAGGRVRCRRRA